MIFNIFFYPQSVCSRRPVPVTVRESPGELRLKKPDFRQALGQDCFSSETSSQAFRF